MARIAVISDTHIPSRASTIPGWVRRRIQAADHTIHAGDFDSADAYAAVNELADGNLTAVRGNTDPLFELPLAASVGIGGVTFVVTHGTGDKRRYEERVASIVRERGRSVGSDEEATGGSRERREATDEAAGTADGGRDEHEGLVGVCGHTHRVLDEAVDGVRLLNPGSATGAAPADRATMMTVVAEDGEAAVTVHER